MASAIVRDLFDGRTAAAKLATISSAMAIAPMLAPMLGGMLDAAFGWRSVFVLYVVMGIALLLVVSRDLTETRQVTDTDPTPPLSALLAQKLFWAYAFCMAFGVGTFFIFLTGAPFVASSKFGLNSAEIGIGLGSITGGFMAGAAISARFVERVGQARLIIAGRVLALSGLGLGAVAFTMSELAGWMLFATTLWVGVGNGLTLPNANAGALSVVPRLAGTAAGGVGALALVLGAALTALTTAILAGSPSTSALFGLMIGSMSVSTIAAITALHWQRQHMPDHAQFH